MQHWLPKNKPGKRLFTGTNENTPGILILFLTAVVPVDYDRNTAG
jgi:hypothetical protein